MTSRKLLVIVLVMLFVVTIPIAAELTRSTPVRAAEFGSQPTMNYPTATLAGNAFISKYEWRHGVIEDNAELEDFLIEEATRACTRLDVNLSLPRAWQAGVDDGMSSDQSATVIELGVEVYCPWHSDKLEVVG